MLICQFYYYVVAKEPGAQLDILLDGGKMKTFCAKREKNLFAGHPFHLFFMGGGQKKCVLYSNNNKNFQNLQFH